MDLAFFANNFSYSKAQYDELTELEKAFMRKGYEDRTITFFTHFRNAVFNGVSNAMRKKGSRFIDLFKKKQTKVDKEYTKNAMQVVEKMEKEQGKSWVDLIYKKNGMKKPSKKGG